MSARIGIDFDNTIAGYDHVFASAAEDMGFLRDAGGQTKKQIRDAVRRAPDGEAHWQKLQAIVYGIRMDEAALMAGAGEFLRRCRDTGTEVFVISHKTRYAASDPGGADLRAAASRWMAGQEFHEADGFAVPENNVYFESTRAEKVARITNLACSHFIDDLEEVFCHPGFPDQVSGFLLATGNADLPAGPFQAMRSWDEISDAIFATVS